MFLSIKNDHVQYRRGCNEIKARALPFQVTGLTIDGIKGSRLHAASLLSRDKVSQQRDSSLANLWICLQHLNIRLQKSSFRILLRPSSPPPNMPAIFSIPCAPCVCTGYELPLVLAP